MVKNETRSVRLSIQYHKSDGFRALQYLAGDSPALTLGRAIALSIASFEKQTTIFTFAEIDEIASWRDASEAFAEILMQAGWAEATEQGAVRLTFPEEFEVYRPKRKGGVARAMSAQRDEKGRYISKGGEGKKRRKSLVKQQYDADGNVINTELF